MFYARFKVVRDRNWLNQLRIVWLSRIYIRTIWELRLVFRGVSYGMTNLVYPHRMMKGKNINIDKKYGLANRL